MRVYIIGEDLFTFGHVVDSFDGLSLDIVSIRA